MSKIRSEKGLDSNYHKARASSTEKRYQVRMVSRYVLTLLAICIGLLFVSLMLSILLPECEVLNWPIYDYVNNMFCNLIVLSLVVIFLDTIVTGNREGRARRDEARAILRHNRIIQPDIDMYLVRKNMVVTPKEKSVRKFQIDSEFSISDMKDMFGPSDLVSDVGMSKISRYAYYQNRLRADFEKLSVSIDFVHYPEISDAIVRYLDVTSYGQAALEAVLGYEDAKAGTRSMKTMVISMIKEESEYGSFADANPTMKNVYLVHQMINDQEDAIADYIRLVKKLSDANPDQTRVSDIDYE